MTPLPFARRLAQIGKSQPTDTGVEMCTHQDALPGRTIAANVVTGRSLKIETPPGRIGVFVRR